MTSAGSTPACTKTSSTKRRRMPASMAAATATGSFSTSLPSGFAAAVSTISPAAARNAPTASAMPMPVVPTIRAAPGVDQAATEGIR